jgi:hypothetical protein
LHFIPIEPFGHSASSALPIIVHFTEHTGVGSWLIVFVHTPLAHSVLMSETVLQAEPNAMLP